MTVFVTHSKIATLPDEPGAEVNKAEWNDNHVIVGLGSAAEADVADFDPVGTANAAVGTHVADPADPHAAAGYITQADGDALYPPLAHDHTGAGQTLIPVEALASENAPANRYIWSALGATGEGKWITTTIYPATSVSLITGTLNAGSITSFATRNDADIYDVQEVASTPGVDVRVSFANVAAFNLLRFQVDHIDGTGTHKVEYALWNVVGSTWDLLTSLRTTNGFVEAEVNSDDFADYIDTGASNTVICRLYHPIAGVGSHQHKWEYMVIVDSIAGGGGISEHGALSGLDVSGSHPATAISATGGTVQSSLDAKALATRAINTTAPVTGGGDLSADRTIAISDFVASGAGHARGAVPDPGASGGTAKFLREDATWATPTGAGYSEVQDEGTPRAARSKLNFIGSGVSAVDNAGTGATDVTISGGAGSVDIKTTEVDFGATPTYYGVFTISDGDVTATSSINVWLSMEAPTGRDADEAEMEPMVCQAKAMATGTFDAVVQVRDGPVTGPYKLNYLVG